MFRRILFCLLIGTSMLFSHSLKDRPQNICEDERIVNFLKKNETPTVINDERFEYSHPFCSNSGRSITFIYSVKEDYEDELKAGGYPKIKEEVENIKRKINLKEECFKYEQILKMDIDLYFETAFDDGFMFTENRITLRTCGMW